MVSFKGEIMDEKTTELIYRRVREATKETRTLYELSEAETILMSQILLELPLMGVLMKLMARLLRAAAHFMECNHDICEELFEISKENE